MIRQTESRGILAVRLVLVLVAVGWFATFGAVGNAPAANEAAVQLDATSGVATGTVTIPSPCGGSGQPDCTGSFTISDLTVGTYTHPALVVGVALNNSFANGYSVAGVTWVVGTTTQILTGVQGSDNTAHTRRVEQFEYIGQTSGAGTITVTVTGPAGGSVVYVAGAISLWNVTTRGPNSCDTPLSGNEDNNPFRSLSRTYVRNGDVDFIAVPGNLTASADSPQTERWNTCTGSCAASDLRGGGSTQPGAANTTNFSWTLSGSTSWVICAVDYRPYEPTLARLREYSAVPTERGTLIGWRTSYEVDNLGFRLFRENADGTRSAVTPSLIAGSALFAGQGTALHSGRSYQWLDTARSASGSDRYWLEEVSLDGLSTLHGPILPEAGPSAVAALSTRSSSDDDSSLLSAVGAAPRSIATATPAIPSARRSDLLDREVQWQLAAMDAARIGVQGEGWYRVAKADLLAAGFDPGDDPAALRLFTGGVEQAISVVTGRRGHFDGDSYFEFYGTGLDTPSTANRVYWLVKDGIGKQAAKRIEMADSRKGTAGPDSYTASVERRDRILYFAALLDETRDNFFGPVITGDGAEQVLVLDRISSDQTPGPTLEVAIQGVTASAHRVGVSLNGEALAEVGFSGKLHKTATLSVSPSFLREGGNSVRLVALDGPTDVSLVDYVRLTYRRLAYASGDTVNVIASPLQAVTVKGFTTPQVRVVDVSRTDEVVELPVRVKSLADGYAVTATPVAVYQGPGRPVPLAQNLLFAFAEERAKKPAWIDANSPSRWHESSNRADLVVITHRDLTGAADALARQRARQGLKTQVIDVEDAYDEFSFGAKDPQAIRDLLARAKAVWKKAPRFVLLLGDATSDPRNYLGGLMTDLVPTKLVPLEVIKSASDDWFVDFDDAGVPQMAIGRVPVQSAAEATAFVRKLVEYDTTPGGAEWTSRATFVADRDDDTSWFSFVDATRTMGGHVPAAFARTEILVGTMATSAAHESIVSALNAGPLLVTYVGHGTDTSWGTGDLLTATDAMALSNGTQLPVVATLNCLNGLFEDPSKDSLTEALLKAQTGGAVAVLASTALTEPDSQLALGTRFYDALFARSHTSTVGEALLLAKKSDVRGGVRRSFLLFGDPSMKLKR